MINTEEQEFAQFASTLPAPNEEQDEVDPEAGAKIDAAFEAELAKEKVKHDAEEKPEGEPSNEEQKPEVKAEKPAPEPKKEEPKKDDKDWKAIAAAEKAKREARAQKRHEELRQKDEVEALRAKAAKLDAILGKSKESKLEAVKEMGLSYDELTEEMLATLEKDKNTPAPLTPEQKRIADLEAKIAAQEKRDAEAEAARLKANREEALRSLDAQILELATKTEDFELLSRKPAGRQAVIKLLAQHHHDSNGEVMNLADACREIEAVLRDDAKGTADTKFVRSLINGDSPKTLTSDMRESGTPSHRDGDDDQEFLSSTLRMLKNNSP